jgi:hypothetical protein
MARGPRLSSFGRAGVVRGVGLVFLVSWLHRSCMVAVPFGGGRVWGVWYGVVV